MAFILRDPGEQKSEGRYKLRDPGGDQDYSYLRGATSATAQFLSDFLGAGAAAFGGGKGMLPVGHPAEQQATLDRLLHEAQTGQLLEQGLSEEEIEQQIGSAPGEYAPGMRNLIDELTGGVLTPQHPLERIQTGAGGTAGEFLALTAGAGGTGAGLLTKEAGIGGLFGGGEAAAEEAGVGPVGQFVAGVTTALSPLAFLRGKKSLGSAIEWGKELAPGEKTPKFLKEAGTPKAMADIELSQKDLVGRVAKTSEEMVDKFDSLVDKVAKPAMKDVGTFRAADIENEIIKETEKALLDTISPLDKTKKKGWEKVVEGVEENAAAAKEANKALYNEAEEGAVKLNVKPQASMSRAKDLSKNFKGSLLTTAEETGVKITLENFVKKIIPSQGKSAKALVKELAEQGILADYEQVLGMMNRLAVKEGIPKAVSVDKLMKTKRSLARITRKADIVAAPVDILKPLGAALKEDILKGLEQNPRAKKIWEEAELLHAKRQKTFNSEPMLKARKTGNPEELSEHFTKPSNLQNLNKALGKDKSLKGLVDRLVVENIAQKKADTATQLAKESREFLGEKGQKALDNILEYGNKRTHPGAVAIERGKILDDIQKASSTGSRPDYVLKQMRNEKGLSLVESTMNKSPKGKKMLDSLYRLSMEDLMASVMKDGHIDFMSAKDIIKDPNIRRLVRKAVGEEGVKFFEQMQHMGKNMAENLNRLEKADPGLFRQLAERMLNDNVKSGLYALAPYTGGTSLVPIVIETGVKKLRKIKLGRILSDRESRKAMNKLGKKGLSPNQTKDALVNFSLFVSQWGSEEE